MGQSTTKKPRKKSENPNAGKRAVFASQDGSETGYDLIGIFDGDSPKAAKKAALKANPELKKRVNEGGVSLAAPPAAGWEATLKEVEPPDPEDFKGL